MISPCEGSKNDMKGGEIKFQSEIILNQEMVIQRLHSKGGKERI